MLTVLLVMYWHLNHLHYSLPDLRRILMYILHDEYNSSALYTQTFGCIRRTNTACNKLSKLCIPLSIQSNCSYFITVGASVNILYSNSKSCKQRHNIWHLTLKIISPRETNVYRSAAHISSVNNCKSNGVGFPIFCLAIYNKNYFGMDRRNSIISTVFQWIVGITIFQPFFNAS